MKTKHIGIKIDHELHDKISYLAQYNDRSISRHVTYLIKQDILAFEKQHGVIVPTSSQSNHS